MAADVALAQALAYARDLRALYEVSRVREEEMTRAHDKLRAAYQQALAYAVDLRKTHRGLQQSIFQSLLGLANALEAKDEYTRGHSERVATLAQRLAVAAGLDAALSRTIARSGLLHDLGKIGVPEHILRKAGPLTEDEWAAMRRHPLTGAQIVRHHHERHDGSGYPDGLTGDGIPIGSRVVAVADVYDALTSDRPYRRRMSHDDALGAIRHEGGRTLDPRLTTLFLDLVADAPPDGAV